MRRVWIAYGVLGLALAPLPLLNVLHVESCAVVAFAAFFVAGLSAIGHVRAGATFGRELVRQEAALVVPLAVLTGSMLWAPNCAYATGLLFYALFPGVTVVLAVALAYALAATRWRRPRWLLVGIGLVTALAGPVYDLGFHPQFYTYNHVFGGVLGPIYDEQLALRPGLFVFRGLSLLWALAALCVGWQLRGRSPSTARAGFVACVLAIGAIYLFSAPLGLNTPAWYVQDALGGHVRTAHFDVYYDPTSIPPDRIREIADDHEWHYARLSDRLNADPDERPTRIQSYLYPTPDVKARLTGARTTSVAPVWLDAPQVHLLEQHYTHSFDHELAHVFGRPFGLPGLGASWAVGLVEGWAVALEAPTGSPAPDDLVAVAVGADTSGALDARADALASRLSPWGFWTGRGAVSYTTMGSFTGFLLDTYGPEPLKQSYAWADLERAFQLPLDSLADGWVRHLASTPCVSIAAHEVVTDRFSRPSLFETPCPHYVPPHRRLTQEATRTLATGDTTRAVDALTRALDREPGFVPAHVSLARIRLARAQADAVISQLTSLTSDRTTAAVGVALGDAYVLTGDTSAARTAYATARSRVPRFEHGVRAQLALRDAVAARPGVVRVLVSADSARVQARRLDALVRGLAPSDAHEAVHAWRALRHLAAREYDRADAAWSTVRAPLAPDRPRAWHRAWTLSQRVWEAEGAYRAGRFDDARRLAQRAAAAYRHYGARSMADRLDLLATRATWAQARSVRPDSAVVSPAGNPHRRRDARSLVE